MRKILLAVDLQRQFKDNNGKYEQVLEYIRYSQLPVYGTIFSQSAKDGNGNFKQYLDMNIALGCDERDIEFRSWANYITGKYAGDFLNFLTQNSIFTNTEIDIVGCGLGKIMAIAFLLWDNGFKFNIIGNQVYDLKNNDCSKVLSDVFGSLVK